jgi:hypothetical protein
MEVIASETEVDNYMDTIFSDAADALSSPMGKSLGERPGSPDSQPSIDFSAATPESTKDKGFALPGEELDGLHDSFDLNESLDLFSNDGAMDDDNKSISDMSSEDESKRKSQKQRKQKLMKERKAPKAKKEEPEIKKVSVVETEIEVIKRWTHRCK